MTDRTDDLWTDGPDPLDSVEDVKPAKKTPAPRNSFIGCPLWWFKSAYEAAEGAGQLAVMLYLYRLTVVRKSSTVDLPNGGLLAELGISRWTKYRALERLQVASLGSVKLRGKCAPSVTLFLRKRRARPVRP